MSITNPELGQAQLLVGVMLSGNTSDAIVSQEAQGAKEMVKSLQLPLHVERAKSLQEATIEYAKLGIVVIGITAGDTIFVDVTLPTGWSRKETGHNMWTEVLDEKGRKRINVFFKAASYDRSAHASLTTFYSVDVNETKEQSDIWVATAVNANGEVVYTTEAGDYIEKQAQAQDWLSSNHPDWRDAEAYWN